jgi:RHS repeat-associated protein
MAVFISWTPLKPTDQLLAAARRAWGAGYGYGLFEAMTLGHAGKFGVLVKKKKDLNAKRQRRCVFRKAWSSRTRTHLPEFKCSLKISQTCFEGPFGEVIRATGPMAKSNPFRFSTKYQDDETDLFYYGYRYYNASTGRWLSADRLGEKGGLNRYTFLSNRSISRVDVLGNYASGGGYTLADMQAMLRQSKEDFRRKLKVLCPISSNVGWTDTDGHKQCCSPDACRVQAELLAIRFAHDLEVNFTTEFMRFGDVIAFFELPPWLPMPPGVETINSRANDAPKQGMNWQDYDQGYGLKCQGMQRLMVHGFTEVITPMRRWGRQCFKGAEVGNSQDYRKASHHWFGIYGPFNDDPRAVDVDADPWFSAGGIISPSQRSFGEAQYFWPLVLW